MSGWLLWTISIMKRTTFCSLLERTTYSGYRFAFPAHNTSAKITICGLTECLIHQHWYATQHASNQGTHFTAKEGQQTAQPHGIYSSYWFPLLKKLVWQNSRMHNIMKIQLRLQLGGNILQAEARFSRRVHMLWISIQNMVLFLPYLGFTGPGIRD